MTAEKSPTPASPTPAAPQQIGPYRILDRLGEGGMGIVYLAEQKEPVRRRAALKVIKLGMDSKAVLARFEAERRALAMMEHSCIATVFDAGLTQQGQPYFAMEYVKGIPITDYCDQNKLGLQERIELFQRVCSGVQHAHLKGVMHRDLKPSNVLVTLQDGKPTPKIIDFGLAKATDHHLVEATLFTEQGVMLGTPEYMSPEQAGLGGLDVDTRTDVYSLGVLLYELLVGELPFARKDLRQAGMMEMQRVIREQEPVKPSTKITTIGDAATAMAAARRADVKELQRRLRGDLDWIVLKALEKDRTRRYETALELAADLQRHLEFEPVLASPPSVGYRVRKFVRRYRVQCAAAAAVFVAIVAGGIGTWMGFAGKLEAERDRARVEEEKSAALRAEAERNQIFADRARLDEAINREEELYPPWPEKVAAMHAWFAEFAEPLAARLPELQQRDATLRAKALPASEEQLAAARAAHPRLPERQRLQAEIDEEGDAGRRAELQRRLADLDDEIAMAGLAFADGNDRFLYRTVHALVHDVTDLTAPAGRIARVRTRLAEAETIGARTIDAHRAKWDDAIAAIRASDDVRASKLYGGYTLTPQMGLVPLRMDPKSKLWEFVDLASGTPGKEPTLDPATDRWVPTGDMGVVFVLLPGGTLPAGIVPQRDSEKGDGRDQVRLDPFFLSKYELTQGQWLRLTGSNPSYTKTQSNLALPVESVDWWSCEVLLRHRGWVLPSELRWEYGCRGGTTTKWWTGDDAAELQQHEHIGSGSGGLAVGSKDANPFGLFDMSGNLWEWCLDDWGDYGTERSGDGSRPSTGSACRVIRGGYFDFVADYARSGIRDANTPLNRRDNLGVRPARTFRP